jgi:hypothetical protein
MRYSTGEEVRLWDRVETWTGNPGFVVCSVDTNEYSERFPPEQWSYLKSGVMLDTEQSGLLHLTDADEDLILRRRGAHPTPQEWAALRQAQFGKAVSE